MKICDFSFLLFLRKNEKTPETLDFTGLSGGVFGVPEVIRTPDLPLRRYVCRIACDVLTYTAVHFDHVAAIIHISCCAIRSTLRAFYNQSNH